LVPDKRSKAVTLLLHSLTALGRGAAVYLSQQQVNYMQAMLASWPVCPGQAKLQQHLQASPPSPQF
jgi:hypothetical protein